MDDLQVGYVAEDGTWHRVSLVDAWAVRFEAMAPARRFPSRKGAAASAGPLVVGHRLSSTVLDRLAFEGVVLPYPPAALRRTDTPAHRPWLNGTEFSASNSISMNAGTYRSPLNVVASTNRVTPPRISW